ncbi:hypothetical protein [Streptomyces sp. NPDC054797]
MISAAVVAAAMGFVPSAALAAEAPAGHGHGVSAGTASSKGSSKGSSADGQKKAEAAAKTAAEQGATFHSPANRSVRTSAKAPQAAASVTDNPGLGVDLSARGVSTYGIKLTSYVYTSVATPITVDINWGDGKTDSDMVTDSDFVETTHVYSELGTRTVTVTVKDLRNNVTATNTVEVTTVGTKFTPHAPTRLLDTRDGTGAAGAGAVAPYGTTRVKVGGNSGIPAGVTAVALNLTATNTAAGGHITAYPAGTDRPITSNVNFVAGQTVPNMTIVPVGADGYVELANRSSGTVDLIADVTGYFTRAVASGYTSLDPYRVVDSREGLGTAGGQVPGQSTFAVPIAGHAGVPYQGVTAVALNVTVTNPSNSGHLTVFPGGQQAPSTSNVNFTAGQTVANSVIVPVGPDGKINIRNGSWSGADVVVDVVGYYSPGSKAAYLPVTPTRLYDTRDWGLALPGQDYQHLALGAHDLSITGYVLNTTVTNTEGDGHLTVSPDPNTTSQYDKGTAIRPTPPNSSNLNWTKGATVPNLVQASTGKNGVIDFWNRSWQRTDLVVDMFGLYDEL